jgi:hypothetical protein
MTINGETPRTSAPLIAQLTAWTEAGRGGFVTHANMILNEGV